METYIHAAENAREHGNHQLAADVFASLLMTPLDDPGFQGICLQHCEIVSLWLTSSGVKNLTVTECIVQHRAISDTGTSNVQIKDCIVDSGDAFLGPASVKGRTGLRACFMNLRTTEADVDFIIERLATLVAQP
jgi:hypothetical protein